MSTQRTKGKVKINQVGLSRMAPGNSEIVHAGEYRHGSGVMPALHKASKYDHGTGPKEYTHMGKSVAGTGKSQNPRQTYLSKRGTGAGTVNE
jgi:hypothetical protein